MEALHLVAEDCSMKTKLRWLREMWKDWWNNQYQMPLRCQKPLVSVSMTVNQGGSVLEKL